MSNNPIYGNFVQLVILLLIPTTKYFMTQLNTIIFKWRIQNAIYKVIEMSLYETSNSYNSSPEMLDPTQKPNLTKRATMSCGWTNFFISNCFPVLAFEKSSTIWKICIQTLCAYSNIKRDGLDSGWSYFSSSKTCTATTKYIPQEIRRLFWDKTWLSWAPYIDPLKIYLVHIS